MFVQLSVLTSLVFLSACTSSSTHAPIDSNDLANLNQDANGKGGGTEPNPEDLTQEYRERLQGEWRSNCHNFQDGSSFFTRLEFYGRSFEHEELSFGYRDCKGMPAIDGYYSGTYSVSENQGDFELMYAPIQRNSPLERETISFISSKLRIRSKFGAERFFEHFSKFVATPALDSIKPSVPAHCLNLAGEYNMGGFFQLDQKGCRSLSWTITGMSNRWAAYYLSDGLVRELTGDDGVRKLVRASFGEKSLTVETTLKKANAEPERIVTLYTFSRKPCGLWNPDGGDYLMAQTTRNGVSTPLDCDHWKRR